MARSALIMVIGLVSALGLSLGCGGGGGGGDGAAVNPVSNSASGFTVSGQVVLEGPSGAALRAAVPSLSQVRVVPRDRQGIAIAAGIRPDAGGRFAFTGLLATAGFELAVVTDTDRVILLRLIEGLNADRADLRVDADSTALTVLNRYSSGVKTIGELESAWVARLLDVSTITAEIKRFVDQSGSATGPGDVGLEVTTRIGGAALQQALDEAFAAGSDPIRLVKPVSGAVLNLGADLECEAAIGFRSSWKKIEFYQNGFKIGEVATRPFRITWARPPAGAYSLEAKLVLPDWSRMVSSIAAILVQENVNRPPASPVILSPTTGAKNLFTSFEARCASFTDPDPGDYHRASDWQVARDHGFVAETIVWSSLNSTVDRDRVTVTGLATGTSYWIRTRHHDTLDTVSSWSIPVSFKTMGFAPTTSWLRCFGGTADEVPIEALALADGGVLVLGTSMSSDGDVGSSKGNQDIWLFRLDAQGGLRWKTVIGGVGPDTPHGVVSAPGGGFVLLASSDSPDGDFLDFDSQGQVRTGFRTLILEIGADGTPGKGFFIYPPLLDFPVGLVADPAGVFLVGGNSKLRDGGYVSEIPYATVLRFSSGPKLLGLWNGREWNGTTLAQLAPNVGQRFSTVGIAAAPGAVVTGSVYKGFGVVSNIGLDGRMSTRNIIAENDLSLDSRGPTSFPLRSTGTVDGGTLVSFPNGLEGLVIKQNSAAGEEWRKALPLFRPLAVNDRGDGRLLVAGIAPPAVGERGWCRVTQLDSAGNLIGRKSFGGTRNATEYVAIVCKAADGGFFTISYTESTDGDVQGNHGGSDILIGKWQEPAE